MNEVYLNKLPKYSVGKNKGNIDWQNSIGHNVEIMYNDNNYTVKIIDYYKNYLTILFDNKEFKIYTGHFKNCNVGKIIGVIDNNFKIEIGTPFKDDKRDLIIADREYRKDKNNRAWKWYKYTCNKCGWTEGWIIEGDLFRGNGCACCSSRTVTPINNIWNNARWMCDLGVSEENAKKYTLQSHKTIEVTCPDCGKKKKMTVSNIYYNKTISCSCGDGKSYISKYIVSLLDQLKADYKTEVKYEWNKYINPIKNNKLSQALIDFVIYKDDREIPLEADGEFHRKDNSMNGMTKEMQQNIDKQRNENCLKYLGEETIRISNEGDIKENILNSGLAIEFDLSKIDWKECEKFALKNVVKEVCNYWNQKEEWETVNDLKRTFKLNYGTIREYLKKGTKLGWCEYIPKEETKKSGIRSGKMKSKTVEVFKGSISLGIFESCAELERQSEERFGVKLLNSKISQVCLGKKSQYKGFTFKYINNKLQSRGGDRCE